MKVSFPLYQSILTGSLRPWTIDQKVLNNIESEYRRSTVLSQNNITFEEFDEALRNLTLNTIKNPTAFGLDGYRVGIDDLIEPTFKVDIECVHADNVVKKFYAVTLEIYHRLFTNFIHGIILTESITPIERKGIINLAINRLRGVLKQSVYVSDSSDLTQFVACHLRASIIKNIIWLEHKFPHLINTIPHDSVEINQTILGVANQENYFSWAITPIETRNKEEDDDKSKESENYIGFRYTNYVTDTEPLKDIHSILQTLKCIGSDVTYRAFEKLFSGAMISDPLVWQADQGALHDFISSLQKHNIIEENKKIWVTTCNTFSKKSGESYDTRLLGQDKGDTIKGRELKKRLAELNFVPNTQQE